MPDDSLYLELVKSLLLTVRDLNYRLANAKMIVALREDIAHRVLKLRSKQEQQQEKWGDVQVRISWSPEQLVEMVDNRLAEIYRSEYTKQPPKLAELLPARKGRGDDPLDLIISRTLYRPRDIIDFLNRCFDRPAEISRLSLSDIRSAEVGYSKARLQAILDEWSGAYKGLDMTLPILRGGKSKFVIEDITEDLLVEMLVSEDYSFGADWLSHIADMFGQGPSGMRKSRAEIVGVWFLVGVIGVTDPITHRTEFSWQRSFDERNDSRDGVQFVVTKMLRSALGIVDREH